MAGTAKTRAIRDILGHDDTHWHRRNRITKPLHCQCGLGARGVDHRIDAAVLEFGPTEIFPPVGAMHRAIAVSADHAAPAGPTHPREKPPSRRGRAKSRETRTLRWREAGFELLVPRCRPMGNLPRPPITSSVNRPLPGDPMAVFYFHCGNGISNSIESPPKKITARQTPSRGRRRS